MTQEPQIRILTPAQYIQAHDERRPMADYPNAQAYIEGEYGDALEDVKKILDRHLTQAAAMGGTLDAPVMSSMHYTDDPDALALDIAGYFTGCLTVNGEPRVARRSRD